MPLVGGPVHARKDAFEFLDEHMVVQASFFFDELPGRGTESGVVALEVGNKELSDCLAAGAHNRILAKGYGVRPYIPDRAEPF